MNDDGQSTDSAKSLINHPGPETSDFVSDGSNMNNNFNNNSLNLADFVDEMVSSYLRTEMGKVDSLKILNKLNVMLANLDTNSQMESTAEVVENSNDHLINPLINPLSVSCDASNINRATTPSSALKNKSRRMKKLLRQTTSILTVLSIFGICCGILFGIFVSSRHLSASEKIESVRKFYQNADDFRYHIRLEVADELRVRYPILDNHPGSTLWSRGDRFVLKRANGELWGQDETGRVWIVSKPNVGIIFEKSEIPEAMKEFIAVRSVRLLSLLDSIQINCDLDYISSHEEDPSNTDRILATPHEGKFTKMEYAEMVIDRETNIITNLYVKRKFWGQAVVGINISLE